MGVDRPESVRSPSFNLCMIHGGPVGLAHVDLFRLGEVDARNRRVGAAAFEALGLDDLAEQQNIAALAGPGRPGPGVLVVEWADFWDDPPAEHLHVRIERPAGASEVRSLEVTPAGERARELARAWQSTD
jgi:tRNA A37 threonylcarbamoyladenosine biosynthesis protein TsaE